MDSIELRETLEGTGIGVESVLPNSNGTDYRFEFDDGTAIHVNFRNEWYDFRFKPGEKQKAQKVAEYLKTEHGYRNL